MKRTGIQMAMWTTGFLATAALLYEVPPSAHSFYPRCPFYTATHLLCPGCGGTRALYEMLHLNFSAALHYNALITALVPLVGVWLGWCCCQAFYHDRAPRVPWPRTLALGLGAVSLLFAVLRNTGIAFVT